MRALPALALLLALTVPDLTAPARAAQPGEALADPAQEARARAITAELRCLVCRNQSIDDSDAPLARDLRLLVRERVAAGEGDAAIRGYLVARYGEFVLLRPPFSPGTYALWLAPFLVLLVGGGALLARARRAPAPAAAPLAPEERARLAQLTGREEG